MKFPLLILSLLLLLLLLLLFLLLLSMKGYYVSTSKAVRLNWHRIIISVWVSHSISVVYSNFDLLFNPNQLYLVCHRVHYWYLCCFTSSEQKSHQHFVFRSCTACPDSLRTGFVSSPWTTYISESFIFSFFLRDKPLSPKTLLV